MLQISQGEPAVRHALVAIGALNERRDMFISDLRHNGPASSMRQQSTEIVTMAAGGQQQQHDDPFAISQYNKAMSHLARNVSGSGSMSVDSTLLACILFICVECLRGDWQLAMRHYYAGMAIALNASQHDASHRTLHAASSRQQLWGFFTRLELLSQLFGHRPAYEYGIEPLEAVPIEFTSVVEARDSIVHIMNLSLRFIHGSTPRRIRTNVTSHDFEYRSMLLGSLEKWGKALYNFLERSQPCLRITEAAIILQIHQIVTTTWLNRCLVPSESVADADNPLYERAVHLAETFQHQISTTNETSTFLFDMEIVSPLYLVAIKCRHPIVRRRAIAVLLQSVRREGLWDSQKAAAIAERVVQIEEDGLWPLDGSVLPKEWVRVCNAQIDSGPGLHPTHHKVTFTTMPDGPGGKCKRWVEHLHLRT